MNDVSINLAVRLQALIDAAIDGIITIDNRGIIESVNPAAANIFQYSTSDLIGQNVKKLMPEPDQSHHDGYIHNYVTTRKPKIIGIGREVKGLRKDGSTFPFRLSISEVVLHDKIIFAGIVHDLSEVSEANEQLRKVNEHLEAKVLERTNELEEAVNKLLRSNKVLAQREKDLEKALVKEKELNELKSRFVSMASHEFRTPLSTVLSSAALIAKYTKTEQNVNREKHINRIKSSVANLTGILNDFLSLSKLEESKLEVKQEMVNLEEMCALVNDELLGLLKKGQYIEHNVQGEPRVIQTDKGIFKNVMFNLLSNAVKYSDEGDKINCNINYTDSEVHVSIIDEGIGIPEHEQKYLFDRFFRASNVENIQGTGLGLNIVKRYILLLKGQISYKSTHGNGSTFTITLPYQT